MAASHRRSGITARDLLHHPAEREAGDPSEPVLAGPVHASTPLEDILETLRAGAVGAVEVVDEEGRPQGPITREDALGAFSRALAMLSEERRVLELAVELQRRALDEATERLQRIRETLDLADELQKGSTGAGPALQHALEEIRRILGGPSRG
jgi:CBS domain-containing protein